MHNSMLISAIRGREGLLLVFSGRGSQMIGEVTDSELKMCIDRDVDLRLASRAWSSWQNSARVFKKLQNKKHICRQKV